MKKLIILLLFTIFTANSQSLFRNGAFLSLDVGTNIWGPNGSQTSIPLEITRYNQENQFTGEFAYSFNRFTFPQNPNLNEWYRWNAIFLGLDPLANVDQYINNYRILVIKSSFSSSSMVDWGTSNDTLIPTKKSVYNYKWHWRSIISVMRNMPNNFFVIWTNAPLVASQTNDIEAQLSHLFCKWAKDTLARGLDPIIGSFPKNIYVFDYFHKVVGTDYKLQPMLAINQNDSRPNSAATTLIAPIFVREICDAARIYEQENMPLQTPVMIYPINDEKNVPAEVILRWHKVPSAKEYYVQVSKGTDFNYLEVDKVIKDTSLKVNLQHSTKYYWRVRAVKDASNVSPWPLMQMFTTVIEKPEVPELVYPQEDSEQIPIQANFIWRKSKRAEEYRLQVATDKQFNYRVINTNFIKDTSYLPSEILQKNTTYYWRVMARNIGGETNWSPYFQFKTEIPPPDAVKLIQPTNNSDSMPYAIIFKWLKAHLTQFYLLQVADNIDFNDPVLNIDDLKDTLYKTIEIFDFDKIYYWRVAGINLSGRGEWSDVWTFSTRMPELIAPNLIYPEDEFENFPTINGTLIWNYQNSRFAYHIQVAEDIDFKKLAIDQEEISDTIFKPTILLEADFWYFCRIRTIYKELSSDWSGIIKFKTAKFGSVNPEQDKSGEISLHPNPFGDYLIISSETNEIIGISIVNMIGHKIYGSKCFAKDARINTSFLQPGVYFFVIQKSNFAQFFFKVIKY